MKNILIIAALLFADHTAVAGQLRADPGTEKLCPKENKGEEKTAEGQKAEDRKAEDRKAEDKKAKERRAADKKDEVAKKEEVIPLTFDPACTAQCHTVAVRVCNPSSKEKVPQELVAAASPPSVVSDTTWQSALVTSLGQLAADRAKAEVARWFEDLVRDKLCELKTGSELWFPATCKLLKDDLGTGQQLLSPLVVQAVENDVPNFIAGLTRTIATNADTRLLRVLTALPALALLGAKLVHGSSPLELLAEAGKDARVHKACRDRGKVEEVTGLCLVMFAGITIDYYGPLIANGGSSLDEKKIEELAVKLLASNDYRCAVYKAFNGDDKACPAATESLGSTPPVLQTLVSATLINSDIKREQLFAVIRDAAGVNEYLRDVRNKSSPPASADVQFARTLDLLDAMWKHIGALVWDREAPESFALFHDAFAAGSALGRKQYRQLVLALATLAADSKIKLPEWAARLMPLVVDLAEAEDAAGVSAAFERAAAPVGSWKAKRQKGMFSVTALVGASAGYEFPLRHHVGSQTTDAGLAGGLFAPIGIEASHPWGSSSVGLLVSVIDVGQITWSRLHETTASSTEAGTKALPEADVSQVFSPGAYLVFGAGKSPFTLGVGASLAPDLRAYTYDQSGMQVDSNVSVWRVGLFAAVDVTLFPF